MISKEMFQDQQVYNSERGMNVCTKSYKYKI